MSKKNKVPTINKSKSRGKSPINLEDPESYYSKHPSWRFCRWDSKFPKEIDLTDAVRGLLPKLHSLEKMTWSTICQANGGRSSGTNSHHIDVSDFAPEAQKRFKELKIDESELFSLRLTGMHRLWGILDNGVFTVIWSDPEHKVCISNKRHT